MSSDPSQDKPVWREALKVSMSCYAPAFLLVLLSCLIFNSASVANLLSRLTEPREEQLRKQVGEEAKKQVKDEVKKQVGEEERKVLATQAAKAAKADRDSYTGKGYIDGQIRLEAKDQAERAAQDEITKVKGDLFSQIAFPVLFAVASIFAAFAVKDILTEVLKEKEREDIKRDLEKSLTDQIVPEVVRAKQGELVSRIKTLESYTCWLEYKLLSIELTQVLSSIPDSEEEHERAFHKEVVEKCFSRATAVLDEISGGFKGIELLREAEHEILKSNIQQKHLEIDLDHASSQSSKNPKEWITRKGYIFEVQMGLLLNTLRKLPAHGEASKAEIDSLITKIEKYLDQDIHEVDRKAVETNDQAKVATPTPSVRY